MRPQHILSLLLIIVSHPIAADTDSYELTTHRSHAFPGNKPDAKDLTFGVIPTRDISTKNYYNPLTKMVEQRLVPAILHPIPVLRARHVQVFTDRPDLAKIGQDQLAGFDTEAKLTESSKFALVGDESGNA